MDHSHSEDQLWGAVEILPQRLYYASLKFFPPDANNSSIEEDHRHQQQRQQGEQQHQSPGSKISHKTKKKPIHYFSIDNELVYWNFFLDFGPLNLGQLYRFCSKLNAKLSSPQYKDCIICYYSGAKGEQRANAVFLMCAWSMLYLGRTLEESYFGFREEFGFEDAGSVEQQQRLLEGLENVSLPPQLRLRRSLSNTSNSSRSSNGGGSSAEEGGNGTNSSDNEKPSPRQKMLQRRQREASPFARLHPLPPFHDASPIVCTYDLSVYDCLTGLDRARQFGFFKFGNTPPPPSSSSKKRAPEQASMAAAAATSTSSHDGTKEAPPTTLPPRHPIAFNVDEYEYFEQVENGDLNWIIQDKILAFAGPQATKVITPEGFCMLTPADYIPYFHKHNVKLVVRLNKKCYDENDFGRVGMKHVTHYYLDGSCPPLEILHAVVKNMESIADHEAMAVHCKAGLGRTGTCIGAYIMKHYRWTAKEVIGWMRICRPGMVIGPQQHFLEDIQGLMWKEGEAYYNSRKKEGDDDDGLRRMSIGSGDEEEVEVGEKGPAASAAAAAAGVTTPGAKLAPSAMISPESIMATPQAKGPGITSVASPGAHVSIVTPDGKPLHLPATPVVARKLDLKRDASDMMNMIVSPPSTTDEAAAENQALQPPLRSTPSSTSSLPTMDALKVNTPEQQQPKLLSSPSQQDADAEMKEGDQANALLSRRLDQYQVRQNEKMR